MCPSPAMDPSDPARELLLDARGVGRSFPGRGRAPDTAALADVDLAVRRGELLALAGPSGSGKTTLLHLLATIDTPTRGEVRLLGEPVAGLTRAARARLRLRHVGLVFAEHNLSPALTAAENVDLPLALRRFSTEERARRTRDALARLGVDALAERRPDELSSGEQQRVALARAIAGDPALLVADEPTVHLDSEAARGLLDLLAELVAERDLAAIVATHDEQLLGRASRVVRLRDGRIEGTS